MKNKKLLIVVLITVAIGCLVLLSLFSPSTEDESIKSLRIAVLLPETGPGASGAASSKSGFEMAIEDLEKQGAVIDLNYYDTQTSPKTAVSIYQQLMLESPPDVIIPELSSVTEALKPLLSGRVLAVATGVATSGISDKSDSCKLFRVFLSADGQGKTAAEYAIEVGSKKAAVVYVNDEYGKHCSQAFKKYFMTTKEFSVIEESFGILDKDFRTSWAKILQEQPDSVFICGYGPGYLTVLKQLSESEYAGLIMTDWSLTDSGYMQATGGVRNGTKVIAVDWSPEFEAEYRARYGNQGSIVMAGYSYVTLQLIWEAYQHSSGSLEALTRKFETLQDVSSVMGNISIQETGDVSANYQVYTVENLELKKQDHLIKK